MPMRRPIPRVLIWRLVAFAAFAYFLFFGPVILGLPFLAVGLALLLRWELSEQGRATGLNPHMYLAMGLLASTVSVLAVVSLLIGGWSLNIGAVALEGLVGAVALLYLYHRLRNVNS